jgi:hypothetical protein
MVAPASASRLCIGLGTAVAGFTALALLSRLQRLKSPWWLLGLRWPRRLPATWLSLATDDDFEIPVRRPVDTHSDVPELDDDLRHGVPLQEEFMDAITYSVCQFPPKMDPYAASPSPSHSGYEGPGSAVRDWPGVRLRQPEGLVENGQPSVPKEQPGGGRRAGAGDISSSGQQTRAVP